MKEAYLDAPPEERAQALGLLQGVLSVLRAQYVHYQTAHWQSKGDTAYGNHLLFERIYKSLTPQIDTLAEKMVGMFGPEAVNASRIESAVVPALVAWSAIECLHRRSLEAEARLQNQVRATHETLKLSKTISLGMDDFLMGLANEHETNEYLIQQVLDPVPKQAAWARWSFKSAWADWTFRRTT